MLYPKELYMKLSIKTGSFLSVLMYTQLTFGASISPELMKSFLQPITFNRTGIVSFFTDTFNHELYGTFALPASFCHMKEFISFSKTMQDPLGYMRSITSLFHDRLKEALWVNPYALSGLLTAYSNQAELWATTVNDPEETVKKLLYNSLLSKFNELKKDPELFMSTLSKEIVTTLNNETRMAQRELGYSITRFIEGALDKIIWDPREGEQCWQSCKAIADQLAQLHALKIIGTEVELNHCYWSLVYRFCYFIETTAEHISLETYQAMKYDIANKNSPLLCIPEQEAFIHSKAYRLQQAVFAGEVKVRSIKQGLWVE